MSKKFRKQLMFDIDTKVSEEILGPGYRRIYDEIRRYLYDNGFDHVQGSGYISADVVSTPMLYQILSDMVDDYPYLEKCIRDIKEANVYNISSLDDLISYDGTPGQYKDYYLRENHYYSASNQNSSSSVVINDSITIE